MTVLEGESLVNDASALVVLRTAVAAIAATGGFSLGRTILDFAWAVVGAVIVGLLVGWLTVLLRQRLDDPVLNTTISFAVPFLAYFPAEAAHASGVLAVVLAGLLTGTLGSKRFSARDRQTQSTTWTTISIILESGVFLAMGYQLPELVEDAGTETTTAEITGLVLIVVGLLIALRFLGLVWPAVVGRWGPDDHHEQVRAKLDRMEEHLDSSTTKDRVIPRLVAGSRQLRETKPDSREQMGIVQRRYLDAMRDALVAERSIGAYSSETYRQVEALLDGLEHRFSGCA